MSSFPAAGYISDNARTEGEVKTAVEDFLAATKQIPGAGVAEIELTISSGSVTPTSGVGIFSIDTEADAASDDLTNIAQTNHADGSLLLIRSVDAARVVVVKHSAGGAGQISLANAADLALRSPAQWLLLKRTGTLWEEVSRSPSAMFGTTQETGHVVVSDKAKPDRVDRVLLNLPAQCLLEFVNATQIKLSPRNGNKILVKDANGWRVREIPSAGITKGTTGLAANTTYYVYLCDNAGTLTLELSTTGRAVDTDTGLPIKSGDATRHLVGLLRTNGSTQFTAELVRSYYHRPAQVIRKVRAAPDVVNSTTYVEIGSSLRIDFLVWAGEVVDLAFTSDVSVGTAGANADTAIGVDTTTTNIGAVSSLAVGTNTNNLPVPVSVKDVLALGEGTHFVVPIGRVSSGSATYHAEAGAMVVVIHA